MALLDLLASSSPFFIASTIILGLLIGSFLNVVIYRLPVIMQREWQAQCDEMAGKPPAQQPVFSLSKPASSCPHCGHQIRAIENIPVISFLWQRGKCKNCGKPISVRYPIIEALTGAMSGIIAWHFGFDWNCLGALILTWSLIALTFIDIDHQLLPDSITLPLVWMGMLFNLFGSFTDLQSSVIGAMAGYLSLWMVFHLFRLITGKEGMGYGDFKLLAVFGAWLGWSYLPVIIILSSLVGAIVGIALVLFRQHDRNIPIPFGPYLAAAGWISLIWGDMIITAYLTWSGIR